MTRTDETRTDEIADGIYRISTHVPDTGPTGMRFNGRAVRRLAELAPTTLAVMHGSSFAGDGRSALLRLADGYDARLAVAQERG